VLVHLQLTMAREKELINLHQQIQYLEFNVAKTDVVAQMEDQEEANYRQLYTDIGEFTGCS